MNTGTKTDLVQPESVNTMRSSQAFRSTTLPESHEDAAKRIEKHASADAHATAFQGSVMEAEAAKAAIMATRSPQDTVRQPLRANDAPGNKPRGEFARSTTISASHTIGLRQEE